MIRTPKLSAIRVFDVAARHLNFRAAASELNVTQGAVAHAVRGLEADLGVRLFSRLPRGVALTEQGAHYHRSVAEGLKTIDRATATLCASATAVTVSVPPSFASKWLVPRLPYFLEQHAGVEVHTIASEAVADLHAEPVDVAIRQGTRPRGAHQVVRALAAVDLVIVGSPSIALRGRWHGDITWFTDQPLIHDSHRHWDTAFAAVDVDPPRPALSFNQTALALDAAINGQGYAIVPRLIASADLASNRLVELGRAPAGVDDRFWSVHLDDCPPNADVRTRLLDWLAAEAHATSTGSGFNP
ncbi:MAG: LysR substrate-binding domain-containing protein [Pseudomonadota bacterium]